MFDWLFNIFGQKKVKKLSETIKNEDFNYHVGYVRDKDLAKNPKRKSRWTYEEIDFVDRLKANDEWQSYGSSSSYDSGVYYSTDYSSSDSSSSCSDSGSSGGSCGD